MKRIGIMQAYFLPYIGYFQLIHAVDEFIIYDNIQYTKKGWINRNRILQGHETAYFTLPLKKDSDFLDIGERTIAASFQPEKMLRRIETVYHKAPCYPDTADLLNRIFCYEERNLFRYILHSLQEVCSFLEIRTPIIISSELHYHNELKGEEKVIAICKERGCEQYINAIGGMSLYHPEAFMREGMELRFIQPHIQEYPQFSSVFVPNLSILDVLMFNPRQKVRQMLSDYRLLKGE